MLLRVTVVLCLAAVAAAPAARRVDPMTGMAFVLVPAGTFRMGTPLSEKDREAQERLHDVTIERAFYLAIHEVTQAEWTKVTGANPSNAAGCAACPVERITYHDVETMLARLNAASEWPGFRLPTEAEWEYACRAGGHEAYGAAAIIAPNQANFTATAAQAKKGHTMPVGSFRPNAWGLFDMSGNVWEWTSDDYAPYPGAVTPEGPAFTPGHKVIRGGSWRFGADSARCGLRYTHRPQDRGDSLGVRLAHDVS